MSEHQSRYERAADAARILDAWRSFGSDENNDIAVVKVMDMKAMLVIAELLAEYFHHLPGGGGE